MVLLGPLGHKTDENMLGYQKISAFTHNTRCARGYSPDWCSGWPPSHQSSACNYVNSGCRGEGSTYVCYCFEFVHAQHADEPFFGSVYFLSICEALGK